MATAISIVIWTVSCLFCTTFSRPYSDLYYDFLLKNYPGLLQRTYGKGIRLQSDQGAPPYWVSTWPQPSVNVGQVSGVAVDTNGDVLVFHRGSRVWDASSFNGNIYANASSRKAIKEDTILRIDATTGKLIDSFGSNIFYMPHGLTVDSEGNIWVTDVALHQVMKIPKGSRVPTYTLGERLIPGSDDNHFCKPTDVAVTKNGDFFVADGYCNGRIMKYDVFGVLVKQWGNMHLGQPTAPDDFFIPHSLALDEGRDEICVADREHGRIKCFDAGIKYANNTGIFKRSITNQQFGKVYAIAYDPREDLMYAVNGPTYLVRNIVGFTLDYSGNILETWSPRGQGFGQPHDVAVSPLSDGSIYVGEISPDRVTKFERPN